MELGVLWPEQTHVNLLRREQGSYVTWLLHSKQRLRRVWQQWKGLSYWA
jgi:hypothetical protein